MENGTQVKFPAWFVQAILYAVISLLSAIVTYTRIEFTDLKIAFQKFKEDIAESHSDFRSRLLLQEYRQNELRKVLDDFVHRMDEWDRDIHGYPPAIRRKTERPNQ